MLMHCLRRSCRREPKECIIFPHSIYKTAKLEMSFTNCSIALCSRQCSSTLQVSVQFILILLLWDSYLFLQMRNWHTEQRINSPKATQLGGVRIKTWFERSCCLSNPGRPLLILCPLTFPHHHPPPHLFLRVHCKLPHPCLGGGGAVLLWNCFVKHYLLCKVVFD